jgi:fused signal recognition particle receptor
VSGGLESEPGSGRDGSFWQKLSHGLASTRSRLRGRLQTIVSRGADEATLEDLEEALIEADLGVETSQELVDALRADFNTSRGDGLRLRERLADEISVLLLDAPQPPDRVDQPRITLMIGVNGVGKTTCIAKLAQRAQSQGRSVLLAAGDTFRAAAIDQLTVWGERLDVAVVKQKPGGDPGAVVFDALQAARARNVDEVIIDTAGRLHTRKDLMDELAKVGRICAREAPERVRRTLLVLDATTGQNAVSQAREFSSTVELDGIFLTKLDGTAKGGIVVALARALRLPVLYLGVGEAADDLVPFRAREFVQMLLR